MTVLEIMIALAIIGFMAYLGYSGFRLMTGAALDEDSNELAAMLRRAQLLSIEGGVPTRVVIDFDKHAFWVEACTGDPSLRRVKEEEKVDEDAAKEELEEARKRLSTLPGGQLQVSSAEEEAKMAQALAGKRIGGRICGPLEAGPAAEQLGKVFSGDAMGRELRRQLEVTRGVKFREVWVQHLEESTTTGVVPIYFFPVGSAEKSVIELALGDEVFSVLIHGLTARVEVKDEALAHPEDHLMRNFKGDKEAER